MVAESLLDLIGSTPLVRLRRAVAAGRLDLRQARRAEPDRLDQGSGGARDGRCGGPRAGRRAARADQRQHRDLAGAGRQAPRPEAHLRDAGERDARAPTRPRALRGDDRRLACRTRAPTVPFGSRRSWLRRIRGTRCSSSTRTSGTRGRTTRAPARRSSATCRASTRSSQDSAPAARLMGTGKRLRESFPNVVVAAAEPLPGDPVMGLRSLDDGYIPPILDVSKLDRKILVSNAESVAAVHALLDREGIFAGVSAGAVDPRGPEDRRRASRGIGGRRRARRRRLEVPLRRLLARRRCRASRWSRRSGGSSRARSGPSCTITRPRRPRTSAAG